MQTKQGRVWAWDSAAVLGCNKPMVVVTSAYWFFTHSWHIPPQTLGTSCEENNKGVFYYVNEVTCGELLGGAGCQWNF